MSKIYDYLDPVNFINDKFKEIKERNSGFSLRAWARQLGMKSHGPLHAILKKQRSIPKKLTPFLIKSLKLSGEEAKYFEALVDFHRAKTPQEKDFYKEKLDKLSPVPLREINDLEAYRYITDPVHITLAEMTQLEGYQHDPAWIKQHYRVNQNMRDIETVMNRLTQLGVIKKQGRKIIKPVEHIYTKYDIPSSAIQNYHKQCSQFAIDQISEQSVDQKEFNAIAFNIDTEDLPEIKSRIRDFVNDLIEEYEAKPGKGDQTYQLNIQLFSLTK